MHLLHAKTPIQKELESIGKTEEKLRKQALEAKDSRMTEAIKKKVPPKLQGTLEAAFAKAFSIVFEKGSGLLGKTISENNIAKEFDLLDYAVENIGGKKEIKDIKKASAKSGRINTVITTLEGVGLGVLGIGLPDIVIWVAFLLRGVYEAGLKYGYGYETPEERYFQLKLIETALIKGEAWERNNHWLDVALTKGLPYPTDEDMELQISKTANAFAAQLLVSKFIQGFPIVGAVGGAANPVYYNKILKYAELKYRKRYLVGKNKK